MLLLVCNALAYAINRHVPFCLECLFVPLSLPIPSRADASRELSSEAPQKPLRSHSNEPEAGVWQVEFALRDKLRAEQVSGRVH